MIDEKRLIRGRAAIANYVGASIDIVDAMADEPECPVTLLDDDFVADAEHLLIWAIYNQPESAAA